MVFLIWQVQEMEQILQKVGEDVLPGVSMSTAQLWLYWDWYEFYMLSQMFDKNLLYEICRHYLGHNNIENDDMKDLSQIQKSPIFNFCHLSCFENFSFFAIYNMLHFRIPGFYNLLYFSSCFHL
jgi:hypothetical protein